MSGPERSKTPSIDGPASGRWSSELSRAVREALELVATPDVASRLLFESLADARLAALPGEHDELRAFAQNELAQLVTERLGADSAQAVVERIDLVLHALQRIAAHRPKARTEAPPPRSGPAPKKPRGDETVQVTTKNAQTSQPIIVPKPKTERRTEPPPAGPAMGTVASLSNSRVVVVTGDPRLGSELRTRVGGAATVLTYRTIEELGRSPVGQVHTLVLDIREVALDFRLSVRPGTLVLWPTDLRAKDAIAARHPHVKDVRFAGEDAGLDDLATVIRLCLEHRA